MADLHVSDKSDPLEKPNASPNSLSYNDARYQMPESILDPGCEQNRPKYWGYGLYRGPDGEKVKVHYCKNITDTERIAALFLNEDVVGFDLEWKPNASANEGIKKNVALIQLASERRIALFHVARFYGNSAEDLVAPTLKKLMETDQISKAGVSIRADCTRLRRYMGIESRGLFELSHLYKLVKYSVNDAAKINKTLVRLAVQVEEHLGLPLFKGTDVRGSDWTDGELNYEQVKYAASDSYAGYQLYHTLEHKRKCLDPEPPRPHHAELNLPIRLASGQAIPTADEQAEDEDPSTEGLARNFISISIKDPNPSDSPSSSTSHASKTPKRQAVSAPPTAEYTIAQEWAVNYRAAHPSNPQTPGATPTTLRAYALWHEKMLSVPEAAAALRTPPLQTSTVASYIIEALSKESLPFDKGRLEEGVVGYLPAAAKGRFRAWLKSAGVLQGSQ